MGAEVAGPAGLVLATTQAAAVAGWLDLGVLVISLGALLGWVRLTRGRRSGAGLGLMALSMFVLATVER
jgi:hypothetical protein